MENAVKFKLSPHQTRVLLDELCLILGFCLPLKDIERLQNDPPSDVEAFTIAVIQAEGLHPDRDVPLHLRRDVRARVATHFRKAHDACIAQ